MGVVQNTLKKMKASVNW